MPTPKLKTIESYIAFTSKEIARNTDPDSVCPARSHTGLPLYVQPGLYFDSVPRWSNWPAARLRASRASYLKGARASFCGLSPAPRPVLHRKSSSQAMAPAQTGQVTAISLLSKDLARGQVQALPSNCRLKVALSMT